MKICRKCNLYFENPELNFCSKCGNTLETINICPSCHTENGLDFVFCKKCGTQLKVNNAEKTTSNKVTSNTQTALTTTLAPITQQTTDAKEKISVQKSSSLQTKEYNADLKDNRKDNSNLLINLSKGIAILAVIIVAGLYFFNNATKSPTNISQKKTVDTKDRKTDVYVEEELSARDRQEKVFKEHMKKYENNPINQPVQKNLPNNEAPMNKVVLPKDILIWQNGNIGYYMDNTITPGMSETGKYFKVTTRRVQNGMTIESNNYSYSQYRGGQWRYRTDKMKGNTSVVCNDEVFEFCMKQLGWPYKVNIIGNLKYYQ